MRSLLSAFCLLALVSVSSALVFAQEAGDSEEARRAAVAEYLKVVPVKSMMSDVAEEVGRAVPPEQSEAIKKAINEKVDQAAIEKAIADAMTKHFTVGEIKAQTAFYSTPEGRSILKKQARYTADVTQVVQRELMKALSGGPPQ